MRAQIRLNGGQICTGGGHECGGGMSVEQYRDTLLVFGGDNATLGSSTYLNSLWGYRRVRSFGCMDECASNLYGKLYGRLVRMTDT